MPPVDRRPNPAAARPPGWTLALAAALSIVRCGSAAAGAGYPPENARPAARPPTGGPRPPSAAAAKHRVAVGTPQPQTPRFRVLATVAGRPAVWIARRDGATLLRFDQRRTELVLHAGTLDAGAGYRHGRRSSGPSAAARSRRSTAAFDSTPPPAASSRPAARPGRCWPASGRS